MYIYTLKSVNMSAFYTKESFEIDFATKVQRPRRPHRPRPCSVSDASNQTTC